MMEEGNHSYKTKRVCVLLMQRYEVGKLLGQGTFAKVYHGRNLKTGTSVAIKVIDKDRILKVVGMSHQIKQEICVMRMVKHPNIVQLYKVMATKNKIYFVMEYVKGGELFAKLSRGKLKEDAARRYFQQLISAVGFCHGRGVYHRDLKPENLLLDENADLKISDFGLSALADSKRQDGLLHTTCGTPAYVAPEVINRRGYDGARADIWSCGVILFLMLAGYLPFHDSNLMEMYKKIGRADFKCPTWISPDAKRLISRILDPNPRTRISIPKIMQNPWFRKGFGVKDDPSKETEMATEGEKPTTRVLNAFEIISFAAGFDLSGLFQEKDGMEQVRFTSRKTAEAIVSKLEEIGGRLKMKKVVEEDKGKMRLQGSEFSIEAEIYEVTPTFHLVEIKKSRGDSLEYQRRMREDIRPGLEDIVWTWQGDQPPLLEPEPELLGAFANVNQSSLSPFNKMVTPFSSKE